MRVSSFAAQNIDGETVANHDSFVGSAVQHAHGFLQQGWFWLAYDLWRYATASFDGCHHGAASWDKATGHWQQSVTIDSHKMCPGSYCQYGSCKLLIVKIAVKADQDDIS